MLILIEYAHRVTIRDNVPIDTINKQFKNLDIHTSATFFLILDVNSDRFIVG